MGKITILCGLCHGIWQGKTTEGEHPFDCHVLSHENIRDKSDLDRLKEGRSGCGYWKDPEPIKYNLPIMKKAIWIIYSDKQSKMKTMEKFSYLEQVIL